MSIGGYDPALVDPTPTEAVAPERPTRESLAHLLRLASARGAMLVVVAAALVGGFAEAAVLLIVVATAAALAAGSATVPVALGPIDAAPELGTTLFVGAAALVFMVALRLLVAWLTSLLAARLLVRLRAQLWARLLDASWERQAGVTTARFQDLASVYALRIANMATVLSTCTTNLLSFLALALAALLVDPLLAVALLVVGALLVALFRPLTGRVRRYAQAHLSSHSEYVDRISGAYAVLPEIRVFGVRDQFVEAVNKEGQRVGKFYRSMRFAAQVLPPLYIGTTLGLLLGGLALVQTLDGADLARVGAIALFLLRGLRYSQQAQSTWQHAVELLPYLDRVVRALATWEPPRERTGARHLERAGTLELRDVVYRYPTGQLGLDGVTVTVRPGEIVGLAGPSGAGKSTLAQMLLGLRLPTGGTYSVDGVAVEEFDPASWFARFAYVAQSPTLIEGDVAANVRFLRQDLDDEDVRRALAAAAMMADLEAWDGGEERQVGDRGSEVSGGQRQRIAIARALVAGPDVLVLDEPTSALDTAAEQAVRDTLDALRGRVTVIVIAHRESTLEVCDRVIHLAEGRVVPTQDR